MTPREILKREHEIILHKLQEFEDIINELPCEPDLLLLREVYGKIMHAEEHHEKEEYLLVRLLNEKGHDVPAKLFMHEHEDMRKAKEVLREIINEGDIERIKSLLLFEGTFLIRKLREHIKKEDEIFFPWLMDTIFRDELPEIKQKFDEIGYLYDD